MIFVVKPIICLVEIIIDIQNDKINFELKRSTQRIVWTKFENKFCE
jgi:hypothetical protein